MHLYLPLKATEFFITGCSLDEIILITQTEIVMCALGVCQAHTSVSVLVQYITLY
jgi:hypothetical protein